MVEMKTRRYCLLFLLGLTLAISVTLVLGEEIDPWVYTTDTSDNPTDEFLPGDTVRVVAYCSITPYDIEVYTSDDGGIIWTPQPGKDITNINTNVYTHDHTDLSEGSPGRQYKLRLLYASTEYAIGRFFIVPELPFGSILGVIVPIVALLGMAKIKRHGL